jgi:nicotinamide riboside transporter PnuC
MDLLRTIEIISLITTIIGLYYVSEKVAIGFLLYVVSLTCQTIIFYKNKNWFLIFQMIVLIIFNFYCYFKWMEVIK